MSGATHSSRCASRPVRLASAGDDIGSRTLSWLLVVMRAEVSETADPHHDTFVCVTSVTTSDSWFPDTFHRAREPRPHFRPYRARLPRRSRRSADIYVSVQAPRGPR